MQELILKDRYQVRNRYLDRTTAEWIVYDRYKMFVVYADDNYAKARMHANSLNDDNLHFLKWSINDARVTIQMDLELT